jgi:hypothetical protein
MCCCRKVALFALVAGVALAALTAMAPNTGVIGEFPDVRFVSIPLLGVSYWGGPLPWLKQVVYPGAPREVVWPNLLADIAFWAVVVAVTKLFCIRVLAKAKAKPSRARKARSRRRAGRKSRRRRR